MKKIYLSPSDQGKNAYAFGNTTEKIQCDRIADALEIALKRCGMLVINNKTASMADRVAESNAWGADLHMPLHTNAFNGVVMGTRIFSYDLIGEGYKAAVAIFEELAPITPGTSENVKAYPALYEVRASNAPCVYIETEFHDTEDGAKWIIEHTTDIAEAICRGVCKYFGINYIPAKAAATAEGGGENRYQTLEELPAWAIPEATELVELGALKGNEKGLDLTEDMLRCMIINLRATKALLAQG